MKIFAITLIALLLSPCAFGEEAKCKLVRTAEWRVRPDYNRPVVDGAINGQLVGVLLDTGSAVSLIKRSMAQRMRLPRTAVEGDSLEAVHVSEFRIGKSTREDWRVLVSDDYDFGDDVAVIIGDDFFRQTDVEFDLRNNVVRVFQTKDCAGVSLAYWSRQALEVALEESGRIEVAVAIDGRPVRALLDSSAARSLVSQLQAAALGVTPQSPRAAPAGCARASTTRLVDSWSAQFESFTIGAETIRNPTLRFADLWQDTADAETMPQMVLGGDFLRSHRVLVARSQAKMYFSYEGGAVFPATTPWGCNAPR
jgi:predicted aspartyl protease